METMLIITCFYWWESWDMKIDLTQEFKNYSTAFERIHDETDDIWVNRGQWMLWLGQNLVKYSRLTSSEWMRQ